METSINLKDIFDMEQWESLQDALAHETKMAIVMVNYKGEPVTKHSECHEFCKQVRKDEKLKSYCQRCDAIGGFEAMRNKGPFVYRCYFSIVDIAIPIVVNKRYVGAVMAGQVRILPEEQEEVEEILHPSNQRLIDSKKEELEEHYSKLPFLSRGRIRVIANMLHYLCNYLCAESAKKQEAMVIQKAAFSNQGAMAIQQSVFSNQLAYAEEDVDAGWIIDAEVSEAGAGKDEISSYMGSGYDSYHEIIKKVFHYIFMHKEERPSLKDMADHCHVSVGYLSHLFSKEVGENYSVFIQRLKIDWAKAMLETTDVGIAEISEKLGFGDTGYFIKVFKKHVGATPLVYKNYSRIK
ncbi:PocR ligand-binding domain-containing protein [Anaerobium acetethylicum]|uniref:Ligand-binding sensor domain-containing protein n=1 Tax=Anaerobium acetethylicum TaxID=1619234 RepID=A0A1D3TV57_9FIRM|nr:PocR ligand-binding domain-containing protein [Anaerobium acetethylicum]SCP97977.1 Ligand-binding sensor domain-containing protein [Anaerobium acetethylicum]